MHTIHKYEIDSERDYTILELPKGAIPLSVQEKSGNIYLWCFINPDEFRNEKRKFLLAGAEHPIEDVVSFVGAVQLFKGVLVLHLFEVLA